MTKAKKQVIVKQFKEHVRKGQTVAQELDTTLSPPNKQLVKWLLEEYKGMLDCICAYHGIEKRAAELPWPPPFAEKVPEKNE